MKTQSPEMKSMFGGTPKGGFFDLPLATPGDYTNDENPNQQESGEEIQ